MIQEIELSKLKNHPMNVRRTYADIDELADSIKKNGVMQNLIEKWVSTTKQTTWKAIT